MNGAAPGQLRFFNFSLHPLSAATVQAQGWMQAWFVPQIVFTKKPYW